MASQSYTCGFHMKPALTLELKASGWQSGQDSDIEKDLGQQLACKSDLDKRLAWLNPSKVWQDANICSDMISILFPYADE